MAFYNTAVFYHVESMATDQSQQQVCSGTLSFASICDSVWTDMTARQNREGRVVMGQIAVHQALADWSDDGPIDSHDNDSRHQQRLNLALLQDEMNRLRIERVSVPSGRTNQQAADQQLFVNVMKCVVQNVDLQVFVLVSGSKAIDRLASLAQTLRELGKTVVGCVYKPDKSESVDVSNVFDYFVAIEPTKGRLQQQQVVQSSPMSAFGNHRIRSVITPPTTPPPPLLVLPRPPTVVSPLQLSPPLAPSFMSPQPPTLAALGATAATAESLHTTTTSTGTTVALKAIRNVLTTFRDQLESSIRHGHNSAAGNNSTYPSRHLSEVMVAIKMVVDTFTPRQYGFATFGEFLQWACTQYGNSTLCLVYMPPRDKKLALRAHVSELPFAIPRLSDLDVHTVDRYRSIVASPDNPPPHYHLPQSFRALHAIVDWLVQHPLRDDGENVAAAADTIRAELLPAMNLSLEDIESTLTTLATALLKAQRCVWTRPVTTYSRDGMLAVLKEAVQEKLVSVLGVVDQDVLDALMFGASRKRGRSDAGDNSAIAVPAKLPKCDTECFGTAMPPLQLVAEATNETTVPAHSSPSLAATTTVVTSSATEVKSDEGLHRFGSVPVSNQANLEWDPWSCQMMDPSVPVTALVSTVDSASADAAMADEAANDAPLTASSEANGPPDKVVRAIRDAVQKVLNGYLGDPQSRDDIMSRGIDMPSVEQAMREALPGHGIDDGEALPDHGNDDGAFAPLAQLGIATFVEFMLRACLGTDFCLALLSEEEQPVLVWRQWIPDGANVLPEMDVAPLPGRKKRKARPGKRQRAHNKKMAALLEAESNGCGGVGIGDEETVLASLVSTE